MDKNKRESIVGSMDEVGMKIEKPNDRLACRWKGGWNPLPVNLLTYFGACGCFLLTVNLPVMPELPWPLIGSVLSIQKQAESHSCLIILIILWSAHYLRRFGEALFLDQYKRSLSMCEVVWGIIRETFFGFWIGWSLNFVVGYYPPSSDIFAPGFIIFIIGEVGNSIIHFKLTKQANKDNRTFPNGCCFQYISHPHYLFEIITWTGFALSAYTLAAFMFMAMNMVELFVYACRNHWRYKGYFNGKDGRPDYGNRKALIPGLL